MLVDALDSDENAGFVELLGVAREWGRPPLTVLAGRPDTWRLDDSLLAAAHARFLRDRVGPSGMPLRTAGAEGLADAWEVDADTVDYAQSALNRWAAERDTKDKTEVVPRVVFHETIKPWER